MKKVLIIGSGGREHALGWKLKQSPKVNKIYFAPGNGGTSLIGENVSIGVEDTEKLLAFAKKNDIDLTIVGPEASLAVGIVDLFQKNDLKIFGPTKAAARLETSKTWAMEFMKRHYIPHPRSEEFDHPEKAKKYLRTLPNRGIVIKADGLALGKGVTVHDSTQEAIEAIDRFMIQKEFGTAGEKILIQERIYGQELSVVAFTDGKTILPLLSAQDHKPAFDNDKGPNTGGMGAYAPVPFVNGEMMKRIMNDILQPAIDGMREEGYPYQGVLYPGLMITDQGPMVIEFNARFGDPETQPQMVLLDSDLYDICMSCIDGTLAAQKTSFKKGAAACVVLTSKGYPGIYEKGKEIGGLDTTKKKDVEVFHAGTMVKDGKTVSSGGRVLGVTAYASTIKGALKKAYASIGSKKIHFEGMHYRKDIGMKASNIRNS